MVHVFRASADCEVMVNSPSRISRLSWHEVGSLPAPMTATTHIAIEDAAAGRRGVLREVHRAVEPDIPEVEADTDDVLVASA
jgi:8-oxo-dGTP diphosphatase